MRVERDIRRFRAQRVGFAIEFLREEIELAADRFVRGEQRARLLRMGGEAVQFLTDIGAGGEHRHFLRQPLFRDSRDAISSP